VPEGRHVIAKHLVIHGRVQGVGYRDSAVQAAFMLNISGWVRNRSDGRVELLSEGSESDLLAFIARIEQKMEGYIAGKMVTWEQPTGEFGGFELAPTL